MLGRLLHLSRYLSYRLLIIHEVVEFQLPEQVQIWTPILTRNIRNIFGQNLSVYCEKLQMKAQFVEFGEGLSNVLQDLILCILNCGDLHSCCQWYRIQVSPWSIPDRQQCKPHQPNLVMYTREVCPQRRSCRLPKNSPSIQTIKSFAFCPQTGTCGKGSAWRVLLPLFYIAGPLSVRDMMVNHPNKHHMCSHVTCAVTWPSLPTIKMLDGLPSQLLKTHE